MKLLYTPMFRLIQIITVLACLVFLNACSEQPQGDIYFPLQEGLEWHYTLTTEYENESSTRELTINSLGQQTLADKSYFIRRTSSGIDYLINFDESGVYREGLRTLVELKPRLDEEKRYIFKYPLEVDSNWLEVSRPLVLLNVFPFTRKVTGMLFPLSYRIESLDETVTVPAGTFTHCLKVVGEGVAEIFTDAVRGLNEIPIKVEEWYAPSVGLVKQVRYEMDGQTIKISDTPAYVGGNSRLELVRYH